MQNDSHFTVFIGNDLAVSGALLEVLRELKTRFDQDPGTSFLIFDDRTGEQVDFDLRGSLEDVLSRHVPARARSGPGRPKLGVKPREVTLLPRHWEWLEEQPSGVSAAIRRLVDEARKKNPGQQQARSAIDATGRFLSAVAGNLPGFEEATRHLYARKWEQFDASVRDWPEDIRDHAKRLLVDAAGGNTTGEYVKK